MALGGRAGKLKRRGPMTAVAALVGGMMAKSATTSVVAYNGDDHVIGGVNVGKTTTERTHDLGSTPDPVFKVTGNVGGGALIHAISSNFDGTERHPAHFVVEAQGGGGEGRFSYMIVGKRANFRAERLPRFRMPPPIPDPPPPPRGPGLPPVGK